MSTPCFTDAAWQRNLPLFNATLALPFNRELAAGTLSRERFQHYMIQAAHYLVAFGRSLAVAAAHDAGRPWVLDPIGAGGLAWRG